MIRDILILVAVIALGNFAYDFAKAKMGGAK